MEKHTSRQRKGAIKEAALCSQQLDSLVILQQSTSVPEEATAGHP